MKAAYLLAFTPFLSLVNLALCVKITVKFDRMNYGCREVEITSKALRIRATNPVREGHPVAAALSNYGSSAGL
jgi:hypothetical protein